MGDFKLYELKYVHFYESDGDYISDELVNVSIEFISKYDFENDVTNWKKVITYNYFDPDKVKVEEYEVDYNIIEELTKIDLRGLKNNYYTNIKPVNFSHFELTYNHMFKIVGTYDQEPEEVKKVKELIGLNDIVNTTYGIDVELD